MYEERSKSTIIICEKCKGFGTIYERNYTGDGKFIECKICDGTGKLLKTENVKYEKFNSKLISKFI